ncbi:MAG: PD-(D/E)XK nuclease family protein [Bacteroidota bacterium]
MKIHYSQYFDDGVFQGTSRKEKATVNVIYLGPMGLLGFLERELGLTGDYPDAMDRANRYSSALRKHVAECPEAFYAQAFETDETGVAKDLLRWRDDLVWLGWKKLKPEEQPQRLNTLARVELQFNDRYFHYGVADRWQDVIESLQKIAVTFHVKLIIYDDRELVHPFFKKLFILLGKNTEYQNLNATISMGNNNLGTVKKLLLGNGPKGAIFKPLSEDNSFSILRLKDNHLAADVLSNQIRQGFKPVVINDENKVLDYYLVANGLPACGSTLTNSNPLIIQLFKLICVGLISPLNVFNLLSLLQSPYSPIPKILSLRLARHLIEKPGVDGALWKEIIENYFVELGKNEPGAKKWKKKRDEVALFLSFNFEPTIDVMRIKNVYASLKGWADRHSLPAIHDHTDEERDQFAYLSRLSETLLRKIQDESEPYDGNKLLKMVESIYEPASFPNEIVQTNSVERLNSPAGLLDNPPLIWWQDCYNSVIKAEQHAFLYFGEIEFLKRNGIDTYLPADQVKMAYEKIKRGILAAESQCVLVVAEKHNGEETSTHPIISEITAGFQNLHQVAATLNDIELLTLFPLQTKLTEEIRLPEPKIRWEIKNPQKLTKRDTESASSIEKLIQHPFEWVIEYQAKLNTGNSFTLPDLFTLKGNIAHATTEAILTQFKNDAHFRLTDELIADQLNMKILEEGLVFMLSEQRFEYAELVRKYTNAIRSLVSIITENELKTIGCEYNAEKVIPGIGVVAGKIDLVLENKQGQQVIFDLKWTKNNKKYQVKLEEGKSVQLAIYSGLLDSALKTGYFMFDSGKLYTGHDFKGGNVIKVKIAEELTEPGVLSKICNSLAFRWKELENGDIEIGDNASLTDLPYYHATEEKKLIPLEMDKVKKIKYGDAYSGLEFFKGAIQ